jgi:DNA-binding NarL/FixJ family response regulator
MGNDIAHISRRPVVVAALPLRRRARERLAAQLGDVRIFDIRETVEEADLVLAPSCSPQTIACLKDAYPTARVVVVEIEDDEFEIDLPGPVLRLLKAGADSYVTADGLGDLASQLRGDRTETPSSVDETHALSEGSIDDIVLSALAEARARRHAQ